MDAHPLSCCRPEGDLLLPQYFTEADHPWLRALIDERERYVGSPRREWDARRHEPLSVPAPGARLALATHALERSARDAVRAPAPPARIRAAVFRLAAELPRAYALSAAAKDLAIPVDAIEPSLFADLPPERILTSIEPPLGPAELAARGNQLLVGSLLRSSLRVRIAAHGKVRAFLREVKLSGLVCTVEAPVERRGRDQVLIDLSGPLALFRHTVMYGRVLARLIPRLAWCDDFRVEADCRLSAERRATLVVSRGDPITAARELESCDSELERRFVRDLGRLARDWEIVREPEPIALPGSLIFPDFELRHRRAPERRWLVELVGFWTREYLERKLGALRAARLNNLIVCIDADRNCARDDLPAQARVVRFRRRVDAREILAIIEA